MKRSRFSAFFVLFLLLCAGCCGANPSPRFRTSLPPLSQPEAAVRVLSKQAHNLNPEVLKLAVTAYNKARLRGYDEKQVLTVIDYSKPSSEKRFWVFDLKQQKLLFNELVAHGRNSGAVKATSFSNQLNSLKSSIGVFATAETYSGSHGYSLRLLGLEPGFNDKAYERALVVHGAWYVNGAQAQTGRLGRSWGCPALNPKVVKPIIDTISDDTVIFAYYPDKQWLNRSDFL